MVKANSAILGDQSGFTLVELLTTMSILSILAAICLAQFKYYQSRAFDARAEHDIRAAITSQEANFVESEAYVSCANDTCESNLPNFKLSSGTLIEVTVDDSGETYEVQAHNPRGLRRFIYRSETGEYRNIQL